MVGTLSTLAVAAALVGSGQTVLLDFSASWCGPCRQMEPVVRQLEEAGFPVQRVDVDQQPDLAAKYRVEGVPTFVLVVDGQEVDRIVGAASYAQLTQLVTAGRAPVQQAAGQLAGAARSVVPAVKTAASALGAATVGALRDLNPWRAGGEAPPTGEAPQWPPAPASQSLANDAVAAGTPAAAAGPQPIELAPAELISVAARLTVDDAQGRSHGTGTVIHSQGDEALVLTCGHVFRDSNGQGPVLVDLFGPGAPQGIPGEVISFDLKRDVGLVRIRPGRPVATARIAPPGFAVAVGDTVHTVGCDNGADPTAITSRVTALNKYLGPPNIEVAGQPVQGRSGGGLFSSEGLVIGVCNAADPEDNEGLFAALEGIHEQLAAAGLAQLATPGGFASAGSVQLASTVPAMPDRMPTSGSAPHGLTGLVPLAADAPPTAGVSPSAPISPAPISALPEVASAAGAVGAAGVVSALGVAPAGSAAGLSPAEQAALETIRGTAGGAEVICVIRSLDDPRAKSEIIVLDRASPELLRQLASERQVQAGRHLTSQRRVHPATAQAAPPTSPAMAYPAAAAAGPRPARAPSAPAPMAQHSPRANWQR